MFEVLWLTRFLGSSLWPCCSTTCEGSSCSPRKKGPGHRNPLDVTKETKDLLSKSPNKVLVHRTKHWLTKCLKVVKDIRLSLVKSHRRSEFVPFDRKNFLHIFPSLVDLFLSGINPRWNFKDETSWWFHWLPELTWPTVQRYFLLSVCWQNIWHTCKLHSSGC